VARNANNLSGYAERRVCIQRTATTTSLVGTVQTIGTDLFTVAAGDIGEGGAPTIAITADDTNEALSVAVTPANATATKWSAAVWALQVNH